MTYLASKCKRGWQLAAIAFYQEPYWFLWCLRGDPGVEVTYSGRPTVWSTPITAFTWDLDTSFFHFIRKKVWVLIIVIKLAAFSTTFEDNPLLLSQDHWWYRELQSVHSEKEMYWWWSKSFKGDHHLVLLCFVTPYNVLHTKLGI